jgi:hypothetical protein
MCFGGVDEAAGEKGFVAGEVVMIILGVRRAGAEFFLNRLLTKNWVCGKYYYATRVGVRGCRASVFDLRGWIPSYEKAYGILIFLSQITLVWSCKFSSHTYKPYAGPIPGAPHAQSLRYHSESQEQHNNVRLGPE